MSDEQPAASNADRPADGVFAKLPDSRPGTRSPRRAGGERASAPEPKTPPATPRTRPAPPAGRASEPAARREPADAAPGGDRREPAADEPGGIEDVAWAGIAAAAEAATIGVRLASKAIEALRGNPGPR